jgi:hydroxymethylglutaryl-CoA lyase
MSRSKIKIVEVGPRDGLQNESVHLSVADRVSFVKKLAASGLTQIETGAFVSPHWVPQMQKSDQVLKKLLRLKKERKISAKSDFSVLVPNALGMGHALAANADHIAIFGACSEAFSKKNINCSIAESFERFEQVVEIAKQHKVRVRGYLSTAFGCPYEGKVKPQTALKLIEKMLKLGVYEVSIGDTIGVATPTQVTHLLRLAYRNFDFSNWAMHFHDTRGTALPNVFASLNYDIRTFDSSVGGLGGCPYAKGASGNLATEDLVYMLEGMGLSTGVDLAALLKVSHWIEKKVGRPLPSRVAKAGFQARYF